MKIFKLSSLFLIFFKFQTLFCPNPNSFDIPFSHGLKEAIDRTIFCQCSGDLKRKCLKHRLDKLLTEKPKKIIDWDERVPLIEITWKLTKTWTRSKFKKDLDSEKIMKSFNYFSAAVIKELLSNLGGPMAGNAEFLIVAIIQINSIPIDILFDQRALCPEELYSLVKFFNDDDFLRRYVEQFFLFFGTTLINWLRDERLRNEIIFQD